MSETLALPVRVRVEDDLGTPVPEVAVVFQASGDGSADPGTAMTNDAGVAETSWTLSTAAGVQNLMVAVAELTADVSATAEPADPADLILVGEVAPTGLPGESIGAVAVALKDAYGNPLEGHVVEFSTADGGTLSPVEAPTDHAGVARSEWTLGPDPGEQEAGAFAADFPSVGTRVTVIAVEPNGAPEVTILAPADGATFEEDTSVELRGEASDPEEGELTGNALLWSSDIAGDLGNGTALEVPELPVGEHTITLTATDSAGAEGIASILIIVEEREPNQAPEATILSPADGATFDEGASVEFRGEASDPEEGELSGNALAWSSDVAGDLGNGTPLEVTDLPVGEHTITLTATDTAGADGSASIMISVEQRESPRFTTVAFSAPYACCTISAAVDVWRRTHVAWVDSTGSDVLMYTIVQGGEVTSTVVAHGDRRLGHAAMALDDAGAPHFAYVDFRSRAADCPANQANIVYAHDADGDGIFETNPVDTRGEACPTNDPNTAEGPYPAIQVTPGIAFAEDGTVTVFYYSFGPGSGRDFMARARFEAGEWNRTVVLNYQNEDVETDQGGVHVAQQLSANEYIPFATYHSMSAGFATLLDGSWETTVFPGHGPGNFARDPRIHTDLSGTAHITWYSTGEDAWLHGTLTDGVLSAAVDTVVVGLRTSGAVEPSAVDFLTGDAYYYAAVDNIVHPAFFSVPDPSGGRTEIEVDLPGFLPFGRVLNVYDGFISLVTRDLDSGILYVHTADIR